MRWLLVEPEIVVIEVMIIATIIAIVLLKIIKDKEKQIKQHKEILQYRDNLTEIYDMMRIFRHNYKNTIITLKGAYGEGDYNKIGEILESLSNGFEQIDNKHQLSIISQIEDVALKWLLISKLSVAQKQKINLSLMVSKEINYGKLKSYEFNSIIGNLFDNAIEAASESDNKQIRIALFNKNGDTIISVKNTYKLRPALSDLYKKGYTKKEGHSGYGLYHIKKIIDKHDEILLDVRITDDFFKVDMNISNN